MSCKNSLLAVFLSCACLITAQAAAASTDKEDHSIAFVTGLNTSITAQFQAVVTDLINGFTAEEELDFQSIFLQTNNELMQKVPGQRFSMVYTYDMYYAWLLTEKYGYEPVVAVSMFDTKKMFPQQNLWVTGGRGRSPRT